MCAANAPALALATTWETRNLDAWKKMSKKNPLVFLDVSIDGDPAEKMVFELIKLKFFFFLILFPRQWKIFVHSVQGRRGSVLRLEDLLHYKGSFFHRIINGLMAQGGDFLKRDGTFGESIYGEKFPDEPPSKLKHNERGLLSMALADRDARGSLFIITFKSNHHLDRKYVVFGKLVQGNEVLKKIENVGDEEGRPSVTVKIINCGEFLEEKKKVSKVKTGKDTSSEANNHEIHRKGKHKKSSRERRRKRRRYYTSESDTSSDGEMESSESESDSDSDSDSDSYTSSSSDLSSSSDERRKKRKRSSKRDKYKRGKRKDKRREKKRRRRDKRSKRRSKRELDILTDTDNDSKNESSSNDDGDADFKGPDRKHKNEAQITVGNQSHSAEEGVVSIPRKKEETADMLEREEERPDVVDDHPEKSRSRSISPKRTISKSMSISPKRNLSKRQSGSPIQNMSRSPSVDKSPLQVSRRSRSISRSPVRSVSGSPIRSVSRSPTRGKKGRSISRSPFRARPGRKPLAGVPQHPHLEGTLAEPHQEPHQGSHHESRPPSRRSISRSPVRAPVRNNRRSYSRSPVSAGRRARSPIADRGRSSSRSPSADGSPKRIRKGRGFSERFSYARRYRSRSPDRSPVRPYRYGSRIDRDRYYRRSPRRYRSPPPRGRTPPRYRGRRSRTRSPVSRSPIRYRDRRSPIRNRSPVETSNVHDSPRSERRRSPSRSRSSSISRSSLDSQSPKRVSKDRSRSSSGSPQGKKGLVSYGDGSPDSGQR
ncbi:cyclophilin-like peptidyl-prolyl cis-trans isomerase family protein [Actinidia rufa]|uniref:Cyclophilin-like peptidyl-prolyl cis-trans isomerase family protein n=1 Tax=Actinidia rufa TaxID=165716 RepID=A0A7J0GC65_9ERIC|nr:cyclophilin-like peptidyl-prolyl cis-trans isomerase family protein [Actinidia rufa]